MILQFSDPTFVSTILEMCIHPTKAECLSFQCDCLSELVIGEDPIVCMIVEDKNLV